MSQQFADFFLGANSPNGFYSLFRDAYNITDGWRVFIIKGGPGTGKSTMMKKIFQKAAELGLYAERGFCSSDPDSLDAVIVPEIKTAVFDGTAPHVLEPELPGACEIIINLADAFDTKLLKSHAAQLSQLSDACSACHKNAVRFLNCAQSFDKNTSLTAQKAISTQKIEKRAQMLYRTHIGSSKGRERTRLLSAVTLCGIKTFYNTISNLCDTVVIIEDKFGSPSDLLLNCIREKLRDSEHEFICCRCSQSKRIEHIILPKERTAFTVSNTFHLIHTDSRITHAERFLDPTVIAENSKRFSYNRRAAAQFYDLASSEMRRAKTIHDKLEKLYSSAVDFSVIDEISKHAVEQFFS